MKIRRQKIGPRMSQAVVYNNMVFLAGQVTNDPTEDPPSDVAGQTRLLLGRIDKLLTGTGTNKSRLLSATIWLADMARFEEMNEVWDAWVSPGSPPARACVEAKLASPAFLIEISVTAAVA
jgi:enamine deaminase RidA (YjgF/YER057c/UK114 family)